MEGKRIYPTSLKISREIGEDLKLLARVKGKSVSALAAEIVVQLIEENREAIETMRHLDENGFKI